MIAKTVIEFDNELQVAIFFDSLSKMQRELKELNSIQTLEALNEIIAKTKKNYQEVKK